jgi:peptidyl-prolyl cis-trans isomerase B (cyclophilin B)
MNLRRNRDREGLMELQDRLAKMAMEKSKEQGSPAFTPEQVDVYTTLGGTPFLDGGYTVFGEVEEGMDIVEAIQNVETAMGDRPKTDVVMNVTVVE